LWKGKPGAVISVSPGRLGGFGANHHLRQSLVVLNVPTMAQPEAYISDAGTLFDEEGRLINENTRNFLKRFLTAYEKWVEIHLP
jgi:chromate reductase